MVQKSVKISIKVLAIIIFLILIIPLSILADSPLTIYPDAHPETSSCDGFIRLGDGVTNYNFSDMVTGISGDYADDAGTTCAWAIESSATSGKWHYLYRGFVSFDTSALPDDAIIDSATLSIYGCTKSDEGSWATKLNVYASNQTSTTELLVTFFNKSSNIAFSTDISQASYITTGYNDFVLNSSGLTYISLTSTTKFCFKDSIYDNPNQTPTWQSYKWSQFNFYTVEKGTGYKPKLVITYHIPPNFLPQIIELY